jgi:hypothetical protein
MGAVLWSYDHASRIYLEFLHAGQRRGENLLYARLCRCCTTLRSSRRMSQSN